MKLNKKELQAVKFIKNFADNLAQGKPTEYKAPDIDQLKRMGIDLQFVSHKKVETLVRGKDEFFGWFITNAPHYIRGKTSKTYLPFQIKKMKEV